MTKQEFELALRARYMHDYTAAEIDYLYANYVETRQQPTKSQLVEEFAKQKGLPVTNLKLRRTKCPYGYAVCWCKGD